MSWVEVYSWGHWWVHWMSDWIGSSCWWSTLIVFHSISSNQLTLDPCKCSYDVRHHWLHHWLEYTRSQLRTGLELDQLIWLIVDGWWPWWPWMLWDGDGYDGDDDPMEWVSNEQEQEPWSRWAEGYSKNEMKETIWMNRIAWSESYACATFHTIDRKWAPKFKLIIKPRTRI